MTPASQAFVFDNGDLILGFQAVSGEGSDKNVFFNLGSPITYRDNGDEYMVIANIGATLASAFGPTWSTRPDVWFGIMANLNANPPSGGSTIIGTEDPVDGDPSRTVYLSTPTLTVGGGQLYPANSFPSDGIGSGAGNFTGLENAVVALTAQPDGAAIMDEDLNPVQWNNGWSRWNPTPGAAFGVFTGGIQQNFNAEGDIRYVDLQRVLATNIGANPTGVLRGGTYETSFGISNDGTVFSVPEPSTALLALGAAGLAFRRRRTN